MVGVIDKQHVGQGLQCSSDGGGNNNNNSELNMCSEVGILCKYN